jgi:hypothetical protein
MCILLMQFKIQYYFAKFCKLCNNDQKYNFTELIAYTRIEGLMIAFH